MEIYERVQALIEDNDTKIQELAEYIGCNRRQITRWTTDGKTEIGIYKLKKICEYYGVSADYILGIPEGMKRPR